MERIIHSLFLFITVLILSGCMRKSSLVKQEPIYIAKFSINTFNGNYSNGFNSSDKKLWDIFYKCKYFRKDNTPITEKTIVNLNYNGSSLVVTAIENNKILNKIELKGNLYQDYYSIKRHLKLIPFPFIFFEYNEMKVILGNMENGNLIVKTGSKRFKWIFIISAGDKDVSQFEYSKLK